MKNYLALGAAAVLLASSLAACAPGEGPMAPRTVGTGDSERTSPGTAPGADPTSVQGATGTEDGQEGQQGQQ